MHVNEFIKAREVDWKRLDALVAQGTKRRRLQPAEIYELGGLYRTTMSDLAVARRDYPTHNLLVFLNQLLTRAHNTLYQDEPSDTRRFGSLITQTIPAAFRRLRVFVAAAFFLFLIPALIGYRLASTNPDIAEPLGLSEQRAILESHQTWTDIPEAERPFASSFIMTNNIRIAILAFGGGVTFGLFTLYIMTFNGLFIGAVLGLAAHYDMGGALFDFIIAHGVLELSIIFMAGGAGLALGWAMLNPGRLTRLTALRVAAREAVGLAVLSIPVLITAGLIEGFISPSDAPTLVKVLVALVSGALLYGYLFVSTRRSVPATT